MAGWGLGGNKFVQVYQASQRGTGCQLALKEIDCTKTSPSEKQALLREMFIHASLKHKNIVQIVDFYQFEQKTCLVTELCRCDLQTVFNTSKSNGGMKFKEVGSIMYEVAEALHYIHGQAVLHRDLKPQNILIDFEGSPKLCDFGFARALSQETICLHSVKGTPLYMAPEQARGESYDSTVDVWSFGPFSGERKLGSKRLKSYAGVILFELIGLAPPWSASSHPELLYKINTRRPDFGRLERRGCPGSTLCLLKRILGEGTRKRAKRPSAEEIMEDESLKSSYEDMQRRNRSMDY